MKVEVVSATDDPEQVICRAARGDYMTEFHPDMEYEEVMESIDGPTIADKERNLIEQLLRRGHYGPFEHVTITFGVKGISRTCMAQITRHRHASFDVQSMRYTAPDVDVIREIIRQNKFDLMEEFVVVPEVIEEMEDDDMRLRFLADCAQDFSNYADYLETFEEAGYPRKQTKQDARFKLPLATKVNMTFTVNLRQLLHIADMRAAGDAQWEVREMTEECLRYAAEWAPNTMQYYNTEMKNRKNRLAP